MNDKFYNKNPNRSVLISSLDSYTITKKFNIDMPFGYLGENILLDYNPHKLKIGTHLKIGDVILEITQNCTICNHLAIIDKSIPELLKNDRGVFAKVIKGGDIKEEDDVCLEF
jgi:MOSC domain-containing protein YiiM